MSEERSGGRIGVLFVCLGNICRSPLARGIFTELVTRRGVADRFSIDSCGTGAWHVGRGADPRTVAVAQKHGLNLLHTARQLDPRTDFARFDLLVAMDRSNEENLIEAGAPAPKVRLMRSFDPSFDHEAAPNVPDPYYGPGDGFEAMYQMLMAANEGLLAHLLKEH